MRMKLGKKVLAVVTVVFMVALAGSGWFYNFAKDRQSAKDLELAQLNSSFVLQYGVEATVKQLTSQSKVYTAIWTDKDSITHVSWNIGGIWVTVYNGPTPTATP